MSPEREMELRSIAEAAADASVKLMGTASAAANQLALTAATAAHALAEESRIDLRYIKADIHEIKTRLDNKYVTVEAFEPIKTIVNRVVWAIVSCVLLAVLYLVIKQPR